MTFSHILLAISHAIALGAGYYAHYRFGGKLAADVAKVRSVV